jgi:hypothetical protein
MFAGTQLAVSPRPVPLQAPAAHWPVLMHWPLGHSLSWVHWQVTVVVLHWPSAHEYAVFAVQVGAGRELGSAQWKSSGTLATLPLQAPVAHPLQGMQRPMPHCESAVHQQTSPLIVALQNPVVHDEVDVLVAPEGMPGAASTQW